MSIKLANEIDTSQFPLPHAASDAFNMALVYRLASAKANLDRLERDLSSKDHSALAAARVEFALASRELADELVERGLHESHHSH